jgi:hypothetical protein
MTTTTTEPVIENKAPKSGARRLGVIGLALVLISAMDSIRNLPTTAMFGWSAIFFYTIAVARPCPSSSPSSASPR